MADKVLAQNTIGPETATPTRITPPATSPSAGGLNVNTSIVDLLKSKNMGSSYDERSALATKYGMTGYTGSASQNMALMALVNKGGPNVDNTKISGSGSVAMNNNADKAALGAATGSGLVENPTGGQTQMNTTQTPLPSGVVSQHTNADGTITFTLADGTTGSTQLDPTVAAAKNQITTSFGDTMAQNKAIFEQQRKQLEEEKQKALKAAEATYDKANPYGEGSDKSEYMKNVTSQYDEAIGTLSTNFTLQEKTLNDNMNAQLLTLNAQATSNARANYLTALNTLKSGTGEPLSKSELSSYVGNAIQAGIDPTIAVNEIEANLAQARINSSVKLNADARAEASQALNDYKTIVTGLTEVPDGDMLTNIAKKGIEAHMFNDDKGGYNPNLGTSSAEAQVLKQTSGQIAKADLAQRTADRQDAMLQATLSRLAISAASEGRLEKMYAVSTINTAYDNFTKQGTPGQQLLVGSSYMSSIEAAYQNKGKGVSALTMIDALVKLDTGGQAVRQGQTDILRESGTYGDRARALTERIFGKNSKVGANTILSPNQVEQIYSLAKNIAKEKISSGSADYQQLKSAVDENSMYAPEAAQAIKATANLGNVDTFIQKYGGTSTGGSSSSSGGNSFSYGGKTYTY